MVVKLHNIKLLALQRSIIYKQKPSFNSRLDYSSRAPGVVFVDKHLEEPVICVSEKENIDIIGPADPLSNLRPVIRRRYLNESALQHKLRSLQDETQVWNQKFWAAHNTKFIKEKNEYVQTHLKTQEQSTLTADEMSEFYKSFLDKNWSTHVTYNIEWYKRNFAILYLATRVCMQDIWRST